MTEIVKIKMLSPDAKCPKRGSSMAAGYDVFSARDVTIQPGCREMVWTDLMMEIPPGMYGRIAPRSGFAYLNAIDVFQGIIDPDFRGNIGILVINNGNDPFIINKNMRICQIVFERIAIPDLEVTQELGITLRGNGGFGSTGN